MGPDHRSRRGKVSPGVHHGLYGVPWCRPSTWSFNARGASGVEIYEAFESLDEQEFIFSERYADEEAFNSHMSTERFKEIMAAVYSLIDGDVRIWVVSQITGEGRLPGASR